MSETPVPPRRAWSEYVAACAIIAATALIAFAIRSQLNVIDIAMLFLLGIVIAGLLYRPVPALVAALLAIVTFDFVFVPPWYEFGVHDARYILTFAMMLLLAVTVSRLATRIREQGRAALTLVEEREAAREVANAEQLRTALLSSLSHDLRTPLGTIEGAASTLVTDGGSLPPDTRRELAKSIVGESQRMARLVSNLLDMVRLESGKLAVAAEWQPLEEPLGVALLRMESVLGERMVRVELPASLPLLFIDGLLIEQVFVNLLENAMKYTPASASISVKAWSEGSDVVVEVADGGAGVPAGEEEAVFRKFHRARGAQTGAEGSGLGLTICQGIVTAHGGRIWVERSAAGGASFRFTLPLHADPPSMPIESGTAPWQ